MTTERQSESARINGAKSHGPISAEGKEKSSRNSLRHGCTATNTLLLACEDPGDLDRMLEKYNAMYKPTTLEEHDLVAEMCSARCPHSPRHRYRNRPHRLRNGHRGAQAEAEIRHRRYRHGSLGRLPLAGRRVPLHGSADALRIPPAPHSQAGPRHASPVAAGTPIRTGPARTASRARPHSGSRPR